MCFVAVRLKNRILDLAPAVQYGPKVVAPYVLVPIFMMAPSHKANAPHEATLHQFSALTNIYRPG